MLKRGNFSCVSLTIFILLPRCFSRAITCFDRCQGRQKTIKFAAAVSHDFSSTSKSPSTGEHFYRCPFINEILIKCQSKCPMDYNQSALYYYYVNLNECCTLGSSELLNVQGCIQNILIMNNASLCSDQCELDEKGCHDNSIEADLIQSFKTKSSIRHVDFRDRLTRFCRCKKCSINCRANRLRSVCGEKAAHYYERIQISNLHLVRLGLINKKLGDFWDDTSYCTGIFSNGREHDHPLRIIYVLFLIILPYMHAIS